MRDHLRRVCVVLFQGVVILVVMSALYILGSLAFYQRLPRWK